LHSAGGGSSSSSSGGGGGGAGRQRDVKPQQMLLFDYTKHCSTTIIEQAAVLL
jgi:hypothetical protein